MQLQMNRSKNKTKQKGQKKFGTSKALTKEEFANMSIIEKFRWVNEHGEAVFSPSSGVISPDGELLKKNH